MEDEPSRLAMASTRPRWVFLDALRGIAALWVAIYHAYEGKHLAQLQKFMPRPLEWFFAAGHFGVPIFFVISGFVIALSVGKDRVTFGYFGRFVLRRSLRLDPPYWASIVLTVGLVAVSRAVIPGKSARLPSGGDLLAHLFYAQGLLGLPQINAIYWTLCIEVQFYLVFCAVLGLSQRFRAGEGDVRSSRWVFGLAAVVAMLWPFHIAPGPINPGLFLPFWHGFLLGAFAYYAVVGTIRWWMFYLDVALLSVAAVLYSNSFTTVCVLVSVLLAEVGRADKLKSWLNWRWLRFAGMISYSLYLVHNPITGAAYNIGYRLTGRGPFTEALWFVLVAVINVGVATSLWYLVERPSLRLGQRLKARTEQGRLRWPTALLRPEPQESTS